MTNQRLILNSSRQTGFILVATIWMLAIIMLIASSVAVWVSRSLELAGEQANTTQASLDMIGTQSTLLYLLSTQVKNQAGLITQETIADNKQIMFDPMSVTIPPITGNEIQLDNRSYSGLGSGYFSLQDEAGLLNINMPNSAILLNLLKNRGLNESEISGLRDKLTDYIDEDDFNNIQGAEVSHYQQKNMPGPANRRLQTQLELSQVLGWNELVKEYPELIELCTAKPVPLLNINAASVDILKNLPEITLQQAMQLAQAREQTPFKSLFDGYEKTGFNLDSLHELLTPFPSPHTRIYLWHEKARLVEQFSIQLTPTSSSGMPWNISNRYSLPKMKQDEQQKVFQPQSILFDSILYSADL